MTNFINPSGKVELGKSAQLPKKKKDRTIASYKIRIRQKRKNMCSMKYVKVRSVYACVRVMDGGKDRLRVCLQVFITRK